MTRFARSALWMIAVVFSGFAQEPKDAGIPVILDGVEIFRISTKLGAYSPQERATAVSQRIHAAAEDFRVEPSYVTTADDGRSTDILVGDRILTTVTDADAVAFGQSRKLLAEAYAAEIKNAIVTYRLVHSKRNLWLGTLYTLSSVVGLLAVLWILSWSFKRLYLWLDRQVISNLVPVRIQNFELLPAERVSKLLILLSRGVRILLTVAAVYFFVPVVLGFFPRTRSLSDRLFGYVTDQLASMFNAFVAYLPNLFLIAILIGGSFYLIKLVRIVFHAVENQHIEFQGFYSEWAEPTYKIVRFFIIVLVMIVVHPYLPGGDSPAFQGISIFLGLMVSLGSSSAVSNVIAGLVLTYTRSFRIGDRVRIGETLGDVVEKTLLVTRIRTPKNVDITIPNATTLSSAILNYSNMAQSAGVIFHTTVTIGYDVPWRTVHALLIGAGHDTEGILSNPAPFVLQTSLDDFYVSYELNAYTDMPNQMAAIYSMLHSNIQDKFNEAGVEIMSPHYRAVREGNQTAIPSDYLPSDYTAPAFRVSSSGSSDS